MSKYFETKKDSLEQAVLEAMSPAQQAAIAISKKEKGEKPKDEKDLDEKAKIEFNDDDKNTISIMKKGKLQGKMTKRSDGTWGVVRGGKHYPIKGGKNLDVAKAAVRDLFGEEVELDKDKHVEFKRYHETKQGSLRDAVLQMWGENVKKESKKDLTKSEKHDTKKMTDTGKDVTPVDMSPKMPKIKNEKNRV